MRAYVWTYRVKPERVADFQLGYSSTGDWARLFAASPEYRGTKLLSDPHDRCCFMTIDYFLLADSRSKFLDAHRNAYEVLDRKWQSATVAENFVGEFDIEE